MKEKSTNMICFILGLILVCVLWSGQILAVKASGGLADSIRSQGRFTYTDTATGDVILVDTADFYYLADRLEQLNSILGK